MLGLRAPSPPGYRPSDYRISKLKLSHADAEELGGEVFMRKLLSIFVMAGTLAAVSADARSINLAPPARPVDDPSSATSLLYKTPKKDAVHGASRGPASVAVSCTDSLGVIHVKGSAGFTACLRTQNLTKPEQALPGNRGDSVGFTFSK